MSVYKIRCIVEWIRAQGKLPRDAYDQALSVDELMEWFGLNKHLSRGEQVYMRGELAAIVEAELLLAELKLTEVMR